MVRTFGVDVHARYHHHNNTFHYKQKTTIGGADKSFARPGWKQATATKLGIYSTYSP